MAGEGLQERINRLKLDSKTSLQEKQDGGQFASREIADPGPAHANEHWRAFYARVRDLTEGLRR